MASTIATTCACGKVFHFYIPKQKFAEIMGDDNEDWEAVDAEEEAAGEIECAKKLAEQLSGGVFVDSRDTEVATCPSCGEEVSLTGFYSHVSKAMMQNKKSAH